MTKYIDLFHDIQFFLDVPVSIFYATGIAIKNLKNKNNRILEISVALVLFTEV